MNELAFTEDKLLGGRILLRQPAEGYRVAIDPIFLAAAVPAAPGELVLDVGAGVGAAALCLAWREPNCLIRGIEIQHGLVRLACENAVLNGAAARLEFMVGDILRPPPRMAPGTFHHVMANPPYNSAQVGTRSENPGRDTANAEGEAVLADWVRYCVNMVRPKGSITFIHRADRLDVLLAELRQRAGDIAVYPLWPGGSRPAGRVIVRARKDVATPTKLSTGMVLHEADGRYTAAAESVLRDGAALAL
ncbi:MAG TPA: methyltransferase [Dongiaceae bacterium]|jgi:tRNA1(Val) A37 N6-methylase TrmN6